VITVCSDLHLPAAQFCVMSVSGALAFVAFMFYLGSDVSLIDAMSGMRDTEPDYTGSPWFWLGVPLAILWLFVVTVWTGCTSLFGPVPGNWRERHDGTPSGPTW